VSGGVRGGLGKVRSGAFAHLHARVGLCVYVAACVCVCECVLACCVHFGLSAQRMSMPMFCLVASSRFAPKKQASVLGGVF